MKKLLPLLALAVCVASPALATHIETLAGTADCEGYEATATVQFSPHLLHLTMEAVVVATDADGNQVATVTDIFPMDCRGTCDFTFAGTFDSPLDGAPLDITATFTVIDAHFQPSASFTTTVECAAPPGDWCPRTPGFWKNHPEDWPVATLTVGGVTLTQAEALAVFDLPVRGDATVILAKHLMAAMLNDAMGAEDMVGGAIDDANAFLVMHPVGSRPRGDAKDDALALKDILAGWNETECPGDSDMDDDDEADKMMATEAATWSTVKGLFR